MNLQLPLADVPCTKTRPQVSDPNVVARACKMLRPQLEEWFKHDNEPLDEAILTDLANIINTYDDGYYFAKRLDEKGWGCDSEMVEILNDVYSYICDAFKEIETQWFLDSGITLKYKIGDKVQATRNRKAYVGEIISIFSDTGHYSVFIESEGHVRTGVGTNGAIFPLEDVTDIPADCPPLAD